MEGYEGDGDFFSKFGLDIRDTTNIILSDRSFKRFIPSTIAAHPKEGDLIYVPVMKKLFEIKFVEEELLFFSLGKRNPYIYELRCELFRYSSESLTTGVEEIDAIEAESSYSVKLHVSPGLDTFYNNEVVYQGANLASAFAKAEVKSFDIVNRNVEVFNIVGKFVVNTAIVGVTSNTSSVVQSVDDMGDTTYYDLTDNKPIQDDAEEVIIVTENNPLGSP